MKLLTASQIRELDSFTIENEPIKSIDLMERAARKCSNWIWKKFNKSKFAVFCGTGNNGGDGLAIARHMIEKQIPIEIYILGDPESGSEDFKTNYERLTEKNTSNIYILNEQAHIFSVNENRVLIDAIFGTGLDRIVEGWRAIVIDELNDSTNTVISIDIPSGLKSEQLEVTNAPIIQANYTLSFQLPKLSFMFNESNKYFGDLAILDIGLDSKRHSEFASEYFYSDEQFISSILRPRNTFSHKGNYGHLLLVSGGKGKMGASIMAARAACRSGLGLLTAHVPSCGYEIMQSSIPESMCVVDDEEDFISKVELKEAYNAIAIGPGIGTSKASTKMLSELIENQNCPMILDADALNILAFKPSLLKRLHENVVLTPHPKEFDRLFGEHKSSFDRLSTLKGKAKEFGIVIVLKGAHTRIALPDGRIYFNSTGNAGMAKGGSGDVLTGIIGSLLAQGYTSTEAAIAGVFIHGMAGDQCAENIGETGMIASDIIEALPLVFKYLTKSI